MASGAGAGTSRGRIGIESRLGVIAFSSCVFCTFWRRRWSWVSNKNIYPGMFMSGRGRDLISVGMQQMNEKIQSWLDYDDG